jgi:asparagine N-glycosylation enzyme membrane subunit Stt3
LADSLSGGIWLRRASVAGFLIIAGVFVAARAVGPAEVVFHESGQVRLLGVDSWFHVRHAEYSRDHFPGLLRNDPGARYPAHGRQQVSGLFNLGIGGVARFLSLFTDEPFPVEPVAAWAPVVLGLAALLGLFGLASYLGGPLIGLLASLVFLLFPGTSLSRSMLGFADQHVLEFALALGSIAGLAICLRRELDGNQRALRPAFLLALPFAAFFYSWLGAPLYIAPMAAAVFACLMAAIGNSGNTDGIARAGLRFFGAVALYQLTVMLFWPDLVIALGRNTKWWMLLGIVALAVLPWMYAETLNRLGGHRKPWLTVSITVVVFLGACAAFFLLTQKGRFFFGQLTGVRGNQVAEQGDILWIDLWSRFGVPGILAALSLPLVLFTGEKPRERIPRVACCVFGLVVFLVWLRTHDFDYAPPIFIALMAALGADAVLRFSGRVMEARGIPMLPRAGVILVVVGGILVPFGTGFSPWIDADQAGKAQRHGSAWYGAMRWLRENTPEVGPTPTTNVADTSSYQSAYGVMSAWDDGNFISHVGKRMPVLSRFPGRRDGQWLTARSEEASLPPICPACRGNESVRYAVVTAEVASRLFTAKAFAAGSPPDMQVEGYWQFPEQRVAHFTYGPAYDEALVTRLVRDRGRGLERYRLVYESPERALLFSLYRPEASNVVLNWLPTGSGEGKRLLELVGGKAVQEIPGGYLYDLVTVPEVLIYEILPAAGRVAP